MADRRMFTKKVTDDENFINLSSSAQALYLHLSMSADDDGFTSQVSVSMFKAHASVQDMEALLEKRYIYQFENGVIVIKHWRMANALRKDRYTPTAFKEELAKLGVKDNGAYTWLPDGCQTGANCLPQDSIGKNSIDKNNTIEAIPLNTGEEWTPTEAELSEYTRLFPSVDIIAEFRNMRAWSLSNPAKKKTSAGVKRFVYNWLSKEQNRPRRAVNMPVYNEKDIPQGETSAEEIERLLHENK